MDAQQLVLVDKRALPEVFSKVLQAKSYLAKEEARNSTDACRLAGLSRSAFYKYKDSVFFYEDRDERRVMTYSLYLSDDPGVLLSVLRQLSDFHVNILTVSQNIPVDRVAVVTISFRMNGEEELDETAMDRAICAIPGVVRAKRI